MIISLRFLVNHFKRLSPLLTAPAALLLSQGQAKAVLTYNIFESGGNVVVQTSGSLNLTGSRTNGSNNCGGAIGGIASSIAVTCTGTTYAAIIGALRISGPGNFDGTVYRYPATSVSGIFTALIGANSQLLLDSAYVSNTPIVSSATFNGTTLASLGFTTTGLIGTWTLDGTAETIQVFLGPPSPTGAAVPGPLPLLGAGAAFGWSRRLRRRIAAPLITPPQA